MIRKTPGVYVRDTSPPQPIDPLVETALPAFIGYTEQAVGRRGEDLTGLPTRIVNLEEYVSLFGGAHYPDRYDVYVEGNGSDEVSVLKVTPASRYFLYESLQHFYENGGGDCVIISIGSYEDPVDLETEGGGLKRGLEIAGEAEGITLLLFPDAVSLQDENGVADSLALGQLQMAALQQCAAKHDRVLLADLMLTGEGDDPVADFRQQVGANYLEFGAAYYPWLYSTFSHDARFRDWAFWEKDGTGDWKPLQDLSGFSSSLNEALATRHRSLVNALRLHIRELDMLVDALGISGIGRREITNIPLRWEAYDEQIQRETEPGEQYAVFAAWMTEIRQGALLLPRLDRKVGSELQKILDGIRLSQELPYLYSNLIAFEKSESLISILPDESDNSSVATAYALMEGGWWLPVPGPSEVAPAGELSFSEMRKKARMFSRDLAKAILRLFHAADAMERRAEQSLLAEHPFLKTVSETVALEMKQLPPSGAVAGKIAETDRAIGVWKAPANVPVLATLGPIVAIDDQGQESLNVHPTGKSINAIRTFRGRGTRIWGARTLAGNDLEWRYLPVRRYFNFVETLVRQISEPFVFEPNNAGSWTEIRFLIDNLLLAHWRKGALYGAAPAEAYYVKVGLGETMTELDILEGRMIVEIGLAVARPAEFIVLRYAFRIEQL